MRTRRSVLFVPADDQRKPAKSATLPADSIVLELEDGVALNMKTEARKNVVEALASIDFGARERLVRVNAPTTDFFDDDLHDTVGARPDGYIVPKVQTEADVRLVCDFLDAAERERGWPAKAIRLLALIETPQAVMNLREIARADDRLDALMFGAEDLAGAIGAVRTPEAWEVLYARSAVVIAAAANGLQAIDLVCNDFTDMLRLERECELGRQLGFVGKLCIHPRQLDIVNRVFAPTRDEIVYARRVVEAHRANQAGGKGAFALDGKMIDEPIVRQAERVLAAAASAQ